jgi:hypothetical protein
MADNEIRVNEGSDGLIVACRSLNGTVEAAGFVASRAAGGGIGRYTGGRLAPAQDEIAQLAYWLYVAGRMATTLRIGYVLYSSSFATTTSDIDTAESPSTTAAHEMRCYPG